MKRTIFAIFIGLMFGLVLAPLSLQAWGGGEPPWNAPLLPGGTTVKTESTAIYIEYNLPYEKVLAFYKDAMAKYPDEKFRDWSDQMYIEDQGGAQWHSIGIFKDGGAKTTVKITRDNMTWVFSTLAIRFAGVFFVLCVLWVFLNINSAVMKKFFPEKKKVAKA
ncbi:MAG TPA: hypothetical protein VGJ94_14100 [Syntrophorhabdaceae bacterium]|jgi:hypothetical protein